MRGISFLKIFRWIQLCLPKLSWVCLLSPLRVNISCLVRSCVVWIIGFTYNWLYIFVRIHCSINIWLRLGCGFYFLLNLGLICLISFKNISRCLIHLLHFFSCELFRHQILGLSCIIFFYVLFYSNIFSLLFSQFFSCIFVKRDF